MIFSFLREIGLASVILQSDRGSGIEKLLKPVVQEIKNGAAEKNSLSSIKQITTRTTAGYQSG